MNNKKLHTLYAFSILGNFFRFYKIGTDELIFLNSKAETNEYMLLISEGVNKESIIAYVKLIMFKFEKCRQFDRRHSRNFLAAEKSIF